ncbi:MAG: TonB-dependent receptor [Candidatus Marinimicrobia bacterium]|nr:TonB-dependent receptor [Candidatus Neomarinimicrobiota bacterium]
MIRHNLPCLTLILITAATIGLAPVFVVAQTASLSGRVTDAETGEALEGTNVVVAGPSLTELRGTATAADGTYSIGDLPVGLYDVTVTYIGYKTAAASVSLAADQHRIIDFALNPEAVLGQELVVSISRSEEKILEAPAAVSVITAKDIEGRPTLSPADHLQGIPAVDIVSNGINQKNVVVRGFNNIFSGSLLSLTDNRIGRVPSLRLNAHNFYTMTNEDIERIEVVLGPGSALYGPNSASGVFHIITKSPFGSEGTIVSLGGGERSILMGSVRHAGSINDKIGYKISAQSYQGNDWESQDPAEPDSILKGQESISNARNFDVEKIAGESRIDYRVSDDMTIIVNGGFNRATNLEPTGVGWAQADAWTYTYFQGRLLYKDFFAQAFLNQSDAGDSRLLRPNSYSPIVDKSTLSVIQLQHGMELGERQRFTYGVDVLRTRPETEGTINGRNEEDDDINEFGVYLQSKTALTDKLDFVAAGRYDDHSRLEDPVISPRAALVFKPTSKDNFRLTYNRAFSTPSSNNLFLDLLAASQAMPPSLVPFLGPTLFDIYGRGVPESGFNFQFGDDGRAQMVSLYGGALFVAGAIPAPNTYLPPDVNSVWPVIRQLTIGGAAADPATQALLDAILPAQLSETVPGLLLVLNTAYDADEETSATNQPFLPPSRAVANVDQIRETITTTFELGYKGLVTDKFLLTASVYNTVIEDFVGPLSIETPHVFIDPATFVPALTGDISPRYVAVLISQGVDQATAEAIAAGLVPGVPGAADIAADIAVTFGPLPIGLISPQEEQNATDVIVTYRNFADKITLTGGEVGFTYLVNDRWRIGGNYAYVDKNLFKNLDKIADVALNAPKKKYTVKLGYTDAEKGLDVNLRLRFVGEFPVISAVFEGTVESYSLIDLNLGYDIPLGGPGRTRFTVTAQNILNNEHQEFVGAPEIGRLVVARITQWF